MSPPGRNAATTAFPGANREDRTERFLSPKLATREAIKILTARGEDVRPAMVRTLVRRFIDDGCTTLVDLERRVISYADPTGEDAARQLDQANWAPKARCRAQRGGVHG